MITAKWGRLRKRNVQPETIVLEMQFLNIVVQLVISAHRGATKTQMVQVIFLYVQRVIIVHWVEVPRNLALKLFNIFAHLVQLQKTLVQRVFIVQIIQLNHPVIPGIIVHMVQVHVQTVLLESIVQIFQHKMIVPLVIIVHQVQQFQINVTLVISALLVVQVKIDVNLVPFVRKMVVVKHYVFKVNFALKEL